MCGFLVIFLFTCCCIKCNMSNTGKVLCYHGIAFFFLCWLIAGKMKDLRLTNANATHVSSAPLINVPIAAGSRQQAVDFRNIVSLKVFTRRIINLDTHVSYCTSFSASAFTVVCYVFSSSDNFYVFHFTLSTYLLIFNQLHCPFGFLSPLLHPADLHGLSHTYCGNI